MAWTYTSTSLTVASSSGQKNVVSLIVGDTSSGDQKLQDEEIYYFLGETTNLNLAGARAADTIAGKYASDAATKKVGDLTLTKARYGQYTRLAAQLRVQAATTLVPLVGGVSIADKQSREGDSDRPSPSFTRGMHDDPAAIQDGGAAASTGTS